MAEFKSDDEDPLDLSVRNVGAEGGAPKKVKKKTTSFMAGAHSAYKGAKKMMKKQTSSVKRIVTRNGSSSCCVSVNAYMCVCVCVYMSVSSINSFWISCDVDSTFLQAVKSAQIFKTIIARYGCPFRSYDWSVS